MPLPALPVPFRITPLSVYHKERLPMPKLPAPAAAPAPLRYCGDGTAIPDVPARDLSADEVQALADAGVATAAQLCASGLYAPIAAPPPPPQE